MVQPSDVFRRDSPDEVAPAPDAGREEWDVASAADCFGVGLIVAGYDNSGAHLFETCPSGNYYEYYALALGARSQSAKTYLEKNFESFPSLNAEELVLYGVRALQASIAQDQELTIQNVAIAIIGKDSPYRELREEEIAEVLSKLPQAVVDTTMEVEE